MKKLIGIILFIFATSQACNASRIINNFDIARWYLDADLVLICDVRQTDTLLIHHHDSLAEDGFHIIYDLIKEKYHLNIDSIIKGEQLIDGTMDTILTPLFTINSRRQKTEFTGLDANGDSIFTGTIQITDYFDDNSYFRISTQKKHLVILQNTPLGYVIDYSTEWNEHTMDLISEVNEKGESYFTDFFEPQTDTLPVYDHYCESSNPWEIDTTTFKYQNDTLYIRNVKSEFCCPRKLQALVKNGTDTLKINVINPDVADCTCDCSYGYTVKVQMAPFESLTVRINNENFNITKADLASSAEDLLFKDLCIFPNPVKDKLHVTGVVPERIEIVNMNGEIQKLVIHDPQNIDVSSLKKGVYILSVYLGTSVWKEKLIKE